MARFNAETVLCVKKWTMIALMVMYLVFAVWWLAAPKTVLSTFIQLGATETVCAATSSEQPQSVEICRSLEFMVRFAAVYFFLILCVLAGIYHCTFTKHRGSKGASDAATASLAAFIPTSLLAAILYVDLSVAARRDDATPHIPTWVIIVTNAPFVALICYIVHAEQRHVLNIENGSDK